MWKHFLVCGLALALLLGGVAQAARDITKPGDPTGAIPDDGNWPSNEQVDQAIDDQIVTKYLHFTGATDPTGLTVTPSDNSAVVTGINLCTANDAPERDPIEYELFGSDDSTDGPWTLISSGAVSEWAMGDPGRRVWLATPINVANTVPYKHYKLMFPACRGPGQNSMQIAEIELLADVLKATAPDPADDAVGVTMPLFQWAKGDKAVFHNVYLGASPDLTDADLVMPRTPMQMYYHVMGFVPGTQYFWRIDEVAADGTIYTGDVWTFLAAPLSAYKPSPFDGEKWLDVTTTLSWIAGQGAMKHEVYFGTDMDLVAARDPSTFKGSQIGLAYNPGVLEENTTYYWVVDELNGVKHEGSVWTFTTVGVGGGARGEYFNNQNLSGMPVLTRIDETIDVTAAIGSPVSDSGWSARWTADLEITKADTFTFALNCHAYTRMWIDGQLIIDKWVVAGVGTPTVVSKYFSLPVTLAKGIHSLQIEYICTGTYAETLTWSTASMAEQVVPAGPLQPPLRAQATYPVNGAADVPQDLTLVWGAGDKAAEHQVYLGDDADAVAAADAGSPEYKGQQADASFVLSNLEWGKTYYWRVDEANDLDADSPWTGNVWSFTTADFLVVDDFDSYTDEVVGRIFQTWIDGWGYTEPAPGDPGNGTSATVGYLDPPFAEQTIVHAGAQSMPLDYNNIISPYYSETERTWATPQDWTVNGVDTLGLWVRGYAAGQTLNQTSPTAFTITGEGADIWNNADEFTYVYKTLNGDGSLIARVLSTGEGTNEWAKGGAMIRDSLDPGSVHTMMIVTPGGGNGASLQWRAEPDGASSNSDNPDAAIAPPYWVKIERVGSGLTGSVSSNGTTWTQIGTTQIIFMDAPAYIGLCVTSHVAGVTRTYDFDSVQVTGAPGQWQLKEVGLTRNDPATMYVGIQDSVGRTAVVPNPDPGAVNATEWTEWKIPLSEFDGVALNQIKKMFIGVGDRDAPTPDGHGMLYIDDIRVVKPAPVE